MTQKSCVADADLFNISGIFFLLNSDSWFIFSPQKNQQNLYFNKKNQNWWKPMPYVHVGKPLYSITFPFFFLKKQISCLIISILWQPLVVMNFYEVNFPHYWTLPILALIHPRTMQYVSIVIVTMQSGVKRMRYVLKTVCYWGRVPTAERNQLMSLR